MSRKGYTYNVIGYLNRQRIMKETITATGAEQARWVAKEILRRRGFNPANIRVEVIRLNRSIWGFL
jgi:hypothetical protein